MPDESEIFKGRNTADMSDEEYYAEVHAYLPGVIVEKIKTAEELESEGWQSFLMELMPFRFEDEFSEDHIKYWSLCWSVLLRVRKQQSLFKLGLWPREDADLETFLYQNKCWIDAKEYARLLILGRGLAKSSTIEAAAVVRACLLGSGYCLYICESQDQSEEHIGNIRELIAHDESNVVKYYPHMEIDPNAKVNGKKTKDRTDLFVTVGGWICRAKGLNASLRGLRIGGLRPDDIKLDDVDGVNDSIAVSLKKAKQITSSVIPTQARRWATIDFGQNLILETGVMNLIYKGKIDAFAERTTIGVSNTFEEFREGVEYKTVLDPEDGRVRHYIQSAAKTTWSGVSLMQAQKFLHDSGLATFLAEYMNSFDHLKTDKVYHEFNEKRHVITWSQFEAKFGTRYIPGSWKAKASGDLGYSLKSESCWFFAACAPQAAKCPGRYFAYRSLTFTAESIDDQAISLWKKLFPDAETGKPHFEATQKFSNFPELFRLLNEDERISPLLKRFEYDKWSDTYREPPLDPAKATAEEKALFYVRAAQQTFRSQIGQWVISHEKSGEQRTLAQKYGLPVSKTKNYKKRDGVQEANHLLRGTYIERHPFFDDVQDEQTGLWRLGSPFIFFVVEDGQEALPRDDGGFKSFREQVASQIWTAEAIGTSGLTQMVPFKAKQADHCDAFRMWSADYATPTSEPKTVRERFIEEIPEDLRYVPKDQREEGREIITPEVQMAMEDARVAAAETVNANIRRGVFTIDEDDFGGDDDYGFDDW